MYLNGKVKVGLNFEITSFNEILNLKRKIRKLNDKYLAKNESVNIIFFLKDDTITHISEKEETFDEIMNSILNENENKNKQDDIKMTFCLDYYVKTGNKAVDEGDVKKDIEKFLDESWPIVLKNKKAKILSHTICVQKAIDFFDELTYNAPQVLSKFYKGLLNEKDIALLSETYATLKIKKREINDVKYNKEVLLNKYNVTLKNDNLRNEIERIYRMNDNKNIQGVNYLFKESDYESRLNAYKVISSALYSKGRLSNPYYYVIEIDINDSNLKSNMLYLKTRLKISRNDMYFFEFSKKSSSGIGSDIFGNEGSSFYDLSNDFFDTIRENQFINTFGFYVDDKANYSCSSLEENELTEKFSFVVFPNKLNKEAQLIYAKSKLKKLNQMDVYNAMVQVIDYQNTQVDGLSTSELDDFIISVLKSKYEKVYRPVYDHITKDMSNGNMTKKLMSMVGFKNLKSAVAELCNKINFKNIKENLLPVTKILSQMSNYERNNWILTGVPGTGKSTAAEILEKVMYQERIIKKDIIVKYTPSNSRDDCVMTPFGPMQITTSSDLQESFSRSVGGVLIIDEIGHLTNENKSLLLQLMEDYKRDVCVILCGYENEAKALLDYNPGFRSRFTHIVKMEEYTIDELLEILMQKLNDKHFGINDEAKSAIKNIIVEAKQVPNFGQARFMESVSDKLIGIHSSNKLKEIEKMLKERDNYTLDESKIYEIDVNDVKSLPLKEMLGDEWELVKNHKDAYSELNNLIGCNSVKNAVAEFVAKSKIDKTKMDRNLIDKTSFNMNMVFYGSPGTAKTTVARLVARIMYDKGMINKPKITEVGAADLVGAYVGHTAIKTTNVFEEAKGGVLFIDEAYSLANERAGGFNQEAIDALIKEMENHRNDTMVILAGYKDKMEELIKCNPGFKSRISKFVDFANYNIDDLIKIFYKLCSDSKYIINKEDESEIIRMIRSYLEEIIDDSQFGNGRECRTILENAVNMQSKRLVDIEDISDDDLMTLKSEDFKFLEDNREFGIEKKTQIGFIS